VVQGNFPTLSSVYKRIPLLCILACYIKYGNLGPAICMLSCNFMKCTE
jgi:hypothetical protein